MEIFISWSGDRSKAVAELLRDWLPKVIQKLRPWISASDIDKGARWLKEISGKLESVNYGIICLTPENLDAEWVLFEAGALSKAIEASYVCPVLFDLEPSSVSGPLSQFQATNLEKDDMKSLLETVNRLLDQDRLTDQQLEDAFIMWWPELEKDIGAIPPPENEVIPERSDREILTEILDIVRVVDRRTSESQSGGIDAGSFADRLALARAMENAGQDIRGLAVGKGPTHKELFGPVTKPVKLDRDELRELRELLIEVTKKRD